MVMILQSFMLCDVRTLYSWFLSIKYSDLSLKEKIILYLINYLKKVLKCILQMEESVLIDILNKKYII